ncbi:MULTISPECIES: XRE family transcriptional regulator [unclassified Modicisalibacter]|uniref:XRE family transcriptional regulator n=1 Tax=unclassified Modicisalibacter TaxID=2679913 RepID=UPI001CC971EF|nr:MULTISPECIES: XRE family transcriptional regulator [unclassified Modicisalibacter]MBZ9559762.1 XRE family transcriptional regulator [Modicisalibacter sp. R2A 31.J]MBZ9577214.1 XRE family transcriptional regulator [Modicisalibacter sp. MOD 31.J]
MDPVRRRSDCARPAQSTQLQRDFDVRDMERRTRLMRVLTRRIALSELGNREIARRAGIPTQRISDLLAGRLEHFSADDLEAIHDSVAGVVDHEEAPTRITPP